MRRIFSFVILMVVLCSYSLQIVNAATSDVTIDVEVGHENKPDNPSGGNDGNGDDYYLRPGISVDSNVSKNGYMIGRPGFIFDATESFTRAEFAVIIDSVFEFDDESITKSFDDVVGHWAEESICRLASNDVVSGVSSKEFDPDGLLKRDQVLLILSRLIYTDKYSTEYNKIDLNEHYDKNTLAQMFNYGIYTTFPEDYEISGIISRGEMVHLVNNIIYVRYSNISEF